MAETKVTANQAAGQSVERRPVICLGDSHTRGFYGASWLNLLRPQFPHLRFINAGNDGEPSESIAARLPGLLAAHPDPAAVIIFSGSNDCIAQANQGLQEYYRWTFRLSQYCSEQNALDNMEKMLQLVQAQAPGAKVLVINMPIMVEDPQHPSNIRTHKYSKALLELVQRKYPTVKTVDFQSACRQHMEQHSPKWQAALQQQQQQQQQQAQGGSNADANSDAALAPTPVAAGGPDAASATAAAKDGSALAAGQRLWSMTAFSVAGNMAWSKFLQKMLLRNSWNAISSKQGLVLLTDQIHINDTAAKILADLVQPHMENL